MTQRSDDSIDVLDPEVHFSPGWPSGDRWPYPAWDVVDQLGKFGGCTVYGHQVFPTPGCLISNWTFILSPFTAIHQSNQNGFFNAIDNPKDIEAVPLQVY